MKKSLTFLAFLSILSIAFVSYSFVNPPSDTLVEKTNESIEWLTWEEAIAKNEKEPKKLFIDVYTDWCGWCKRMDASTFKDKDVVKYMNENFYSVKLDAEMKKEVKFKDHTFKFVANGRRGYHELAAALLENKMSYPSFVAMDEKIDRITIIPGYRDAKGMMPILEYIGGNNYKTMTYGQYEKTLTK